MQDVEDLDPHCRSWGDRPLAPVRDAAVPQRIWSYWHDPRTPDFIRACVETWRRQAPGFDIRLLDRDSAARFTGPVPWAVRRRSPTAISDWIRLRLLHDQGGIWMDASTLLFAPLRDLLPARALAGPDPFAFHNRLWSTDPARPMVESWLIAAPPRHPLIGRWLREYALACISRKTYLALMKAIHGRERIFQGYPAINYFTVFAALQVVLRRDRRLRLLTCDSERGPYRLHARLDYDTERIARALTDGPLPDIPWIKLSGEVRQATMARIAASGLSPQSPLVAVMPAARPAP